MLIRMDLTPYDPTDVEQLSSWLVPDQQTTLKELVDAICASSGFEEGKYKLKDISFRILEKEDLIV